MKRYFYFMLVVAGYFLLNPVNNASAQNPPSIAAVVNDNIVSVFDLQARVDLVIIFANLKITLQNRQRFAPQVLKKLIDEKLKISFTNQFNIKVNKSTLKSVIKSFEDSNGIENGGLGAFLRSQGLSKLSLVDQFETDLIWNQYINGRYGNSVHVDDEEVESIIATMKKNAGQTEYLLGEIFLSVDNISQEQKVFQVAKKLLQQIQSGARFDSLALNFSQSPSAPVRGDIGWVSAGSLEPSILNSIKSLKAGEISQIIRGKGGFYIMALRDQRVSKGLQVAPQKSASVSLYQIHLPLSPTPSATEVQEKIQLANSYRAKSQSCETMDTIKSQSGSSLSGNLGTLKVDQLSPQLQGLIKGVPKGKTSMPLKTGDGVIYLMVCDRKTPISSSPQNNLQMIKNNVTRQLREKQLDHFSKQQLRELRRSGFVDIRL